VIKGVLFDLDETLILRSGAIRAFIHDQYRRFASRLDGIPEDRYVSLFLQTEQNGVIGKDIAYPEFVKLAAIASVSSDELLEDYRKHYAEFASFSPGALETVRAIDAEGRKLGVLSNGNARVQNAKIDALGLRRRDYLDKAQALLKLAGLEAFAKARPNELSGGMQQRAALCRALIYDPPFLLMDEPFGALDALTRDQMNVELMRIWSETRKATLLITHSVAEAVFLADRVLVMSGRPGTILADVAIDLPRPRQTRVRTTPVFAEYVRRLSAMLGVHD